MNKIGDKKLLDFLLAHNIIVEDNDTEDYSLRKNEPAGKTGGFSLYLLFSQSCNLGCVYCLNGEKTYKVSKDLMMKEEVAYRGIDKLARTIIPEGEFSLVFFGGEPLLNWDLAKKIIVYCEEKIKKDLPRLKIKYHLTSNLTLFPDDLIEWAKRYKLTFLCDVDGPEELHNRTRPFKNGKGSYEIIVRNIERLRSAGLEVALRTTVTSINMNHIKEISVHHKEIGGAGSAFVSVNAVTSDEDILDKSLLPDPDIVAQGLKKLIKSKIWDEKNIFPLNRYLDRIRPEERNVFGCGAPYGNTPVLDVQGDIYACIYLVEIKRYKTGNVFSDDEVIKYTKDIACKVNRAMIEEALWLYAKRAGEEKERLKDYSSGGVCC